MLHRQYYAEQEKQERLLAQKNEKSEFYNGILQKYKYPVLTREHIPLHWKYDLNPNTNPYFMERLGVNAVMNSGAIELNGKFYLVARIEGNDRTENMPSTPARWMILSTPAAAEALASGCAMILNMRSLTRKLLQASENITRLRRRKTAQALCLSGRKRAGSILRTA